jgi:histidinol phosphatase-like PHP family hydrolase
LRTRAAHLRNRAAGVVARWEDVFAEAARHNVAIEIDGDPARQDLDHTLATQALAAGCLFALDSDAHTTLSVALCGDCPGARPTRRYSSRTVS